MGGGPTVLARALLPGPAYRHRPTVPDPEDPMARILLVEDTPDVHALLVETLQAEGHEVRGAHDGLEARRLLAQSAPGTPGGPELVVLDPLIHGPLALDPARVRATLDGIDLALTATKLRLLELLMDSPGRARDTALAGVPSRH
jgi:DNA-binding response OmpR family regulator